ncbi:hypothetical protein ACIGO6_37770 [Streptomyces sp. NPDC053750]|uniref:hypothetical protein n=1 Tax=Streptomyces sp. NPDC053750 TaxID=3365714 RepID=UPI0037D1E778
MADEPQTTPVQERVRQRFADELTANHAEQEELTGQIAALQQRLDQLRADETWLTQAQSSLPTTGEPANGASGSAAETPSAATVEQVETVVEAPQTVPAQRQKQTAKKAAQAKKPAARKSAAKKPAAKKSAAEKKTTVKKAVAKAPVKETSAKKTAPAAEKSAAKKTAAEQAASPKAVAANASAGKAATSKAASPKAAATKAPAGKGAAGGPPLWELLLGVLRKTPGQPLVAREVSDQLAKDHPDRATSAQTVRNGLQTLVTKNLAEKTRQQGNVMYTAHADTPAATATLSPAGGEPASDKAEQATEKVPAEV